jgi:hypothetical protein
LMLHLHMTVQPVLPTTQPQPQPQPPAALHPMRISQLGQNYSAFTGTDCHTINYYRKRVSFSCDCSARQLIPKQRKARCLVLTAALLPFTI